MFKIFSILQIYVFAQADSAALKNRNRKKNKYKRVRLLFRFVILDTVAQN